MTYHKSTTKTMKTEHPYIFHDDTQKKQVITVIDSINKSVLTAHINKEGA
jgi:hypothetical protein